MFIEPFLFNQFEVKNLLQSLISIYYPPTTYLTGDI